MPSKYPTENWHNFRLTRRLPNGKLAETTDFHFEVRHAAEDDFRDNRGIVDVVKVEWKGLHVGPHWLDVTELYRNLFSEVQNGYTRH